VPYASRANAGMIFADYLANCVSMQDLLLKRAQLGNASIAQEATIPSDFKRPVFTRVKALGADIHECVFALTASDLKGKSVVNDLTDTEVKKRVRIVIVKPMVALAEIATSFARSLAFYQIKDLSTQVIVVSEDMHTLPGTIRIQNSGDTRDLHEHLAMERIITQLQTSSFLKWRLGVGRPNNGATQSDHLNQEIPERTKEMHLFGYSLDVCGQAFQHYLAMNDLKLTKKKYAGAKKMPSNLRQLPGLIFPIDVVDPDAKKPELVKEEEGLKHRKDVKVAGNKEANKKGEANGKPLKAKK